jgi:hypothetical protein
MCFPKAKETPEKVKKTLRIWFAVDEKAYGHLKKFAAGRRSRLAVSGNACFKNLEHIRLLQSTLQ